ncbi:SMP-30/gluconolactonase/LRE family protein [Spirosoma aerolatum]|uniref:SMP-30/gluconolactonase/LRE family protein n=1 Tax=Spirosoma aerolatum TaxID=1211326 RepID=UPI001C54C465|nr:SMP-30/gluconolactonase/LRE family protein [Spirosoma aerolatum]
MNRRHFIAQSTLLSSLMMNNLTHASSTKSDLLAIPNLLCLWDFAGKQPLRSKGKYPYLLQEPTGPISMLNEGVLSDRSLDIREHEYLTIPRADCPGLNIRGKQAQVTVLAWVKRQVKSRDNAECEAIAGMWNETQKKRQYCLFLNIRLHDSKSQVCGHISGVGGPTPGEKWCVDVSIGQTPVRYDEWTFVAMTYDGHFIKSYRNGQFDARTDRNPYPYDEGIFDGGEDGADFTVGAVHRLGAIGNDFVGQLGGLAVFDRALSADEIAGIHAHHPLPGSSSVASIATGLNFPEGPAFAADGSLWAVELKGECLVQYKNGKLKRYHVGGGPNGIAIDKQGHVWFCDSAQRAIRRFDPMAETTETILDKLDGEPLNKPNDLAFDAMGNLLFTCPGDSRQEPTGYAVVRMQDGTVKKFTADKYFPNGLAFGADGKTLVLAETYKHRLWKGEWNPNTGEWTNATVWATVEGPQGPGGPDGMAFGDDGNLYVAVYGTGYIHVIAPEGKVIRKLNTVGQNPTNCAFDPTGKLGLVVTEAEKGHLKTRATNTKGVTLFN